MSEVIGPGAYKPIEPTEKDHEEVAAWLRENLSPPDREHVFHISIHDRYWPEPHSRVLVDHVESTMAVGVHFETGKAPEVRIQHRLVQARVYRNGMPIADTTER